MGILKCNEVRRELLKHQGRKQHACGIRKGDAESWNTEHEVHSCSCWVEHDS